MIDGWWSGNTSFGVGISNLIAVVDSYLYIVMVMLMGCVMSLSFVILVHFYSDSCEMMLTYLAANLFILV